MIRFFIGLILVITLAAGGAFYFLQKKVSFSVSFTDDKKLVAGDIVYLSGLPVGKVVKIVPDNGKVRVGVHVDRKFWDQFTRKSSFFIGPDPGVPDHMSLLTRNPPSGGGSRLNSEDNIEGLDSFLVWSSLEVADKVHEMIRSEPWQPLLQEVGFVAQDLEKAIKKIDIDRLGAQFRADIETLSKNIDTALQGNDSRNALYELQNQTEHILQRLKQLGDSEESRQLQAALNNFQKRLIEEMSREKYESEAGKVVPKLGTQTGKK